jgi:leucyl aminopeptidase (aminopeptidase T)
VEEFMSEQLSREELLRLIDLVFRPGPADASLAFLVDLPDGRLPDNPGWRERREMVAGWHQELSAPPGPAPFQPVDLVHYRNVRSNNADLPSEAWIHREGDPPRDAEELDSSAAGAAVPMRRVLAEHRILIAATELSATAPLKLAAKELGFRAATMPGFSKAMIPALRLDYEEIHRRCTELKSLLDRAAGADILVAAGGRDCRLHLDLRHRTSTASGGLVRDPGMAANLPSGETFIVPYEGEIAGDPSRSAGVLPLELEGELFFLEIEGNRVRKVEGAGPRAAAERAAMKAEPAYSNVAELGLGILAAFGIRPVGELLLDEKLGLHIAFGRSDHFGGQTGAKDFSSPDKVVHIDRVYLPELQPGVRVLRLDLQMRDGALHPLMRDGRYV